MTKRDESDNRWDSLTQLLHQMRDGLDQTLEEAQRRFATSPDAPLSAPAVEVLVAAVRDRRAAVDDRELRDRLTDLIFSWDTNGAIENDPLENGWDEACGIVGWQPRMILDQLMTDVDSTSVDTRELRWTRVPIELRDGADPIVLDVWAGLSEPSSRSGRKADEGSVRWDARLDAPSAAMLEAVGSTTSFDFSDYDDEVIKELMRN